MLQRTLSCGERLCLPAFTACSLVATTHALLRRATGFNVYQTVNSGATTPALLRRATLMRRHLEGIDLATTHALLRRATWLASGCGIHPPSYNSRSPAESVQLA